MTIYVRLAAVFVAMPLLALAACSPATPPTAATAASVSSGAASGDPAALPQSCRSLLASMKSCSDNLAHAGSPLAESTRGRSVDMRNAISSSPPAERASFCEIQTGAFNQLAQTYHCQ